MSCMRYLGSAPRYIKYPVTTNEVNIDRFLNMLVRATPW
jgi:hypothetical protein